MTRLMRWSNKGKPLVNIKHRANKLCIHYKQFGWDDEDGAKHTTDYCALKGPEHTCGYWRKVKECPRMRK